MPETTRKRMRGPARKQQIVQLTLRLVAEGGVQAVTMSRIAEAAGISEPSLYSHFSGRNEILLAALDVVFEKVAEIHRSEGHESDALERLRRRGRYFSWLVASEDKDFLYPLFEFIAAPPSEGLREALAARELAAIEDVAAIVALAKEQGTIAPYIDSMELAVMIIGCSWAEGVAHLMAIDQNWQADTWARMLNLLLAGAGMAHSAVMR